MKSFKKINIEQWSRKGHYEFFLESFLFPHTTLTAPVDVTNLVRHCRENKVSVFHASVFLISKALNGIAEFRQRIGDEGPIEWEKVSPSYTILGKQNEFLFCDVEYVDDFKLFVERSVEISRKMQEGGFETDLHKDDDRLFMSCLPWVDFTQVSHPVHSNKTDAVPRVAWGKITENNGNLKMPLNIQAHHSFVDGLHFGLAFKALEDLICSL